VSVVLPYVSQEGRPRCIHGVVGACEPCRRFVQELKDGLSKGYVSDARKIVHARLSAEYKQRPDMMPSRSVTRLSKADDEGFEEYRQNYLSLIEEDHAPAVPGDWLPQHRSMA
jgi:hypothetical protein